MKEKYKFLIFVCLNVVLQFLSYSHNNNCDIGYNWYGVDSLKLYENKYIISTGNIGRMEFLEYVSNGDIAVKTIQGDSVLIVLSEINKKMSEALSIEELKYGTFEEILECKRMYNNNRKPMPFHWENINHQEVKGCVVIHYNDTVDLLWYGKTFIDFKQNRYIF